MTKVFVATLLVASLLVAGCATAPRTDTRACADEQNIITFSETVTPPKEGAGATNVAGDLEGMALQYIIEGAEAIVKQLEKPYSATSTGTTQFTFGVVDPGGGQAPIRTVNSITSKKVMTGTGFFLIVRSVAAPLNGSTDLTDVLAITDSNAATTLIPLANKITASLKASNLLQYSGCYDTAGTPQVIDSEVYNRLADAVNPEHQKKWTRYITFCAAGVIAPIGADDYADAAPAKQPAALTIDDRYHGSNYRIVLVGYIYPALRATLLAHDYVPFTHWDKSESSLQIMVSGPGGAGQYTAQFGAPISPPTTNSSNQGSSTSKDGQSNGSASATMGADERPLYLSDSTTPASNDNSKKQQTLGAVNWQKDWDPSGYGKNWLDLTANASKYSSAIIPVPSSSDFQLSYVLTESSDFVSALNLASQAIGDLKSLTSSGSKSSNSSSSSDSSKQ